jgi:hypothetical protein
MTPPKPDLSLVIKLTSAVKGLTAVTRPIRPPLLTIGMFNLTPSRLPRLSSPNRTSREDRADDLRRQNLYCDSFFNCRSPLSASFSFVNSSSAEPELPAPALSV